MQVFLQLRAALGGLVLEQSGDVTASGHLHHHRGKATPRRGHGQRRGDGRLANPALAADDHHPLLTQQAEQSKARMLCLLREPRDTLTLRGEHAVPTVDSPQRLRFSADGRRVPARSETQIAADPALAARVGALGDDG